jgi:hypothetical protein
MLQDCKYTKIFVKVNKEFREKYEERVRSEQPVVLYEDKN